MNESDEDRIIREVRKEAEKKSSRKRIKHFLAVPIFVLIFYLGVKPWIVTTWTTESVAGTYEIRGRDGRDLYITFLPNKRVLMAYREEATGYLEVVQAKAVGQIATHYFGPLWSVARGGYLTTPFDFRLYLDDERPAIVEMKIERKYTSREGLDVFPKTGDSTVSVLLFRPQEIRFGSMWLKRRPADDALVAKSIQLLDMMK